MHIQQRKIERQRAADTRDEKDLLEFEGLRDDVLCSVIIIDDNKLYSD